MSLYSMNILDTNMEEFVNFPNSLKPSISFVETEHSLDSMSQLDELNGLVMENPNLGFMGYSNDISLPVLENFSSIFPIKCAKPTMYLNADASIEQRNEDEKRKSDAVSEMNSLCTSETKKRNISGSVKRRKRNAMEMEKPLMEVVHVRARRGQATDSHSLAERVRREKINERMRCLQDLVPGCYKTMGMAGMLDEIINYVQSLQNQVEFLSMKLSAASILCDFGLDVETPTMQQLLQGVGDAYEAQELERVMIECYGDQGTSFQPAMHF